MAYKKTYRQEEGQSGQELMDILRMKREWFQMEEEGLLGSNNDPLEKEADQVAEKISSGEQVDTNNLGTTSSQPQAKAEEGATAMEKSISGPLEASKGGGQALEDGIKGEMEGQMNTDLGDVRIHNDANAHQMSEDINAKAFTHGQDIYFNQGNFDPHTKEGKNLLAHELTHTQQQANGARRMVQRSMKVEIQTKNFVWAIKNAEKPGETYKPDATLLGRKYGPTSEDFDDPVEDGNLIAYLSKGFRGESAREEGSSFFKERKGEIRLFPVFQSQYEQEGIKANEAPHYTYKYSFVDPVNINDIIGEEVDESQLDLLSKTKGDGDYERNTFRYIFTNNDGNPLNIHIDQNGNFQEGSVYFMKLKRVDLDSKEKEAEHTQIWKLTPLNRKEETEEKEANQYPEAIYAEYLDNRARLEMMSSFTNSDQEAISGTYEKKYYLDKDFKDDGQLKKKTEMLSIHLEDGKLKNGHVRFMEEGFYDETKEQSAIELQSESHGFLEFETPKWFRKWSELKPRIEDAKYITEQFNAQINTENDLAYKVKNGIATPEETSIAEDVRNKSKANISDDNTNEKNAVDRHHIVEWPDTLSKSHLSHLEKGGYRLLVQIKNYLWPAAFQISEAIPLSEYSSLMRDYEEETIGKSESNFFSKIIDISGEMMSLLLATTDDDGKEYEEYANLRGFLELITNYIYRGHFFGRKGEVSKATFRIMARTDFASMYRELLSDQEKRLYKKIANNKNGAMDTFLQKIGSIASENYRIYKSQKFFRQGVGSDPKKPAYGPEIGSWLESIASQGENAVGKDSLSTASGMSSAMGAKTVETEVGDKDYKLAKFEIRGMRDEGHDNINASAWVDFVKERFESAKKRSSYTPDDLSTEGDETNKKTSLKK